MTLALFTIVHSTIVLVLLCTLIYSVTSKLHDCKVFHRIFIGPVYTLLEDIHSAMSDGRKWCEWSWDRKTSGKGCHSENRWVTEEIWHRQERTCSFYTAKHLSFPKTYCTMKHSAPKNSCLSLK